MTETSSYYLCREEVSLRLYYVNENVALSLGYVVSSDANTFSAGVRYTL